MDFLAFFDFPLDTEPPGVLSFPEAVDVVAVFAESTDAATSLDTSASSSSLDSESSSVVLRAIHQRAAPDSIQVRTVPQAITNSHIAACGSPPAVQSIPASPLGHHSPSPQIGTTPAPHSPCRQHCHSTVRTTPSTPTHHSAKSPLLNQLC